MKNLFKMCLLAIVLALGIGMAFGQFTWTKDARNPVFSGVNGTWSTHVFSPCVLFNSDSARYEMWFSATPGPQSDPQWRPYSVGFAVSKDGIHWTMYPSPVLSSDAGKWDSYTIDEPEVRRENGQYKMWYSSWANSTSPQYLGYATSPDGVHWTKYSGNPIFGPGTAAWEVNGPWSVSLVPFRGGYNMWYTGYSAGFGVTRIGYATSVDGVNWKRDTVHSPMLNAGASGQWDAAGVWMPNVLAIGDSLYMWYVADSAGNGKTGLAVSQDGITNWTKYASNPIIVPSAGTWDADRTYVGSVLLVGDTLHIWYVGWKRPFTSNQSSIGHAWSLLPTVGVVSEGGKVPVGFSLSQNYPNPFNPRTVVRSQTPEASNIRIVIYDLLGREVKVLVNEKRAPGYYEDTFDASGLASGVYIYRMTAGSYVESRRMILLK